MRLDPAAIRAESVTGDLRVQRRGFNNRMAMLLGPDDEPYMLPVLDKVRLLAMNDRGVLLSGVECFLPRGGAKGSGPRYRIVVVRAAGRAPAHARLAGRGSGTRARDRGAPGW